MENYNTIYATREQQEDRIRRIFGHPELKPHNNSLKLIFETVNDVGGYIDESAAGHQYDAGCFAIRFNCSVCFSFLHHCFFASCFM